MRTLAPVLRIFALALALLSTSAFADSIYSVTNAAETSPEPLCLGGDCFSQALMASWDSVVPFNNVSIFGEVGGDDSSAILTAFLTNQVGPGTTVSNQIASVTLTPPAVDSPGLLLFSGLSLGPGTYYLVLSGLATETSLSYWYQYDNATVTTAPGVSAGNFGMANSIDPSSNPNPTYIPASTFDTGAPSLSIKITGTLVTTASEPSSYFQMVSGFALLGVFRMLLGLPKASQTRC